MKNNRPALKETGHVKIYSLLQKEKLE